MTTDFSCFIANPQALSITKQNGWNKKFIKINDLNYTIPAK